MLSTCAPFTRFLKSIGKLGGVVGFSSGYWLVCILEPHCITKSTLPVPGTWNLITTISFVGWNDLSTLAPLNNLFNSSLIVKMSTLDMDFIINTF